MGIIKSNDIRGIYPDELDSKTAFRIGFYLKDILGSKKILVGRDGRSSSAPLFEALSQGITASGADVVSIGECDTPAVYFATVFYSFDASVMITASHNPAEYNGFKFSKTGAVPVGKSDGLEKLAKLMEKEPEAAEKKGKVTTLDISEDYAKHVRQFAKIGRKMKVVVDCSQGAACFFAKKILSGLPCDFIHIYDTPDGNFTLHDPNPLKSSVHEAVAKAILSEKADFGVCFDGDADRAIFLDEKGKFISPDIITSFFAWFYRDAEKGWKAFYDIRSSNSVREFIEKNGGNAAPCRTGHSHIKKLMKENDALFAGELSGHYYFRDNFFCDSGFIAFLLFLSAVSGQELPLSTLLSDINPYSFSGEINFRVKDMEKVIAEVGEKYTGGRKNMTDGMRIDFDDWWFIIRQSTAEPVLRLVVEAKTREEMERHASDISSIIRK